jgi:hypothetical protein
MNRNLIRAVLFSLLVFIVFPVQADDARHPHHIGVALGGQAMAAKLRAISAWIIAIVSKTTWPCFYLLKM